MSKYLIKLVLTAVILIAVFVGIYLAYGIDNETFKYLITCLMTAIPVIFLSVFIKQLTNAMTSLAKSLMGIAPNSVSKILEAAIFILENNEKVVEKLIIRRAIKIVVIQKHTAKKNKHKRKEAIETVTELFLAKSKIENLRAKFIAVIGIIVLTIASLLYSQSLLACIIPITFFIILEVKIRVLEFRVTNGFFGNNRLEALQLLQFITDKKNKDDFDNKNGKRKIFIDLLEVENSQVFNSENGVLQ
ncbi:hypothetical protein U2H36_000707 [Escherichia coli]|nr:hypothetical protein [Escherichia coli]EMA2653690.1 hypothetical protein [Escherichia coli]